MLAVRGPDSTPVHSVGVERAIAGSVSTRISEAAPFSRLRYSFRSGQLDQQRLERHSMTSKCPSASPDRAGINISVALNKHSRSNLPKLLARMTSTDRASVLISDLDFVTSQDQKIEHLISLRTARMFGAHVQWQKQIQRCFSSGFSQTEIDGISRIGRAEHDDDSMLLLCDVVDSNAKTGEVSNDLLDALLSSFNVQTSAKIVVLIDWWNIFGKFLL